MIAPAKKRALAFLQTLVGQTLRYSLKSPDTELYDFGFGEMFQRLNWRGETRSVCPYVIHALCRFKVIQKVDSKRVFKFYEDSSPEQLQKIAKHLYNLPVKRVGLSEKNDLWLDLEQYWIVFVTFENGEESWRFFNLQQELPHLVASDSWLKMDA